MAGRNALKIFVLGGRRRNEILYKVIGVLLKRFGLQNYCSSFSKVFPRKFHSLPNYHSVTHPPITTSHSLIYRSVPCEKSKQSRSKWLMIHLMNRPRAANGLPDKNAVLQRRELLYYNDKSTITCKLFSPRHPSAVKSRGKTRIWSNFHLPFALSLVERDANLIQDNRVIFAMTFTVIFFCHSPKASATKWNWMREPWRGVRAENFLRIQSSIGKLFARSYVETCDI